MDNSKELAQSIAIPIRDRFDNIEARLDKIELRLHKHIKATLFILSLIDLFFPSKEAKHGE